MTPKEKRDSKNDLSMSLMGLIKISDHNIRSLQKAVKMSKNRSRIKLTLECKDGGTSKYNLTVE
jgi:hypothetical protein